MDKKNMYSVALYIRLSREDGDKEESDSVSNQRKILMDYIEKHEEFILQDVYIDDGFTGTNFERPDFKRMIAGIERKEINCVIVKDLSRFGRDYIDTGRYLERYFPEMGVRFISLSDGIDSLGKMYDMMLPIKNIFNEQYARDISMKIHSTVKMKQEAGEFIGSFASYGYKKAEDNKNKLVIDEYPASIVRRIFDMYISGIGKQKIARILTQEGIPCPSAYKELNGANYKNLYYRNSTKWSYSTINNILHKEIYIGNMVQGTKHQIMRGKQKKIAKSDWVVVKNTHEPIIDMDTWNRAQKMLTVRTRELNLENHQSIFAGFLRCGDCDAAMSKVSWQRADGSMSRSFYCGTYKRYGNKFCTPHTMPSKVLEQIVLDDLKTIISSIDNLEELIKENAPINKQIGIDTIQAQLNRLNGDLNKIRKYKQAVYEDWKENIITKEEYLLYKEDYVRKEELLISQIDSISQMKESNNRSDFLESKWIKTLLEIREIDSLDRNIVVDMIDKIYVYENRHVRIVYNFTNELEELFKKYYEFRN